MEVKAKLRYLHMSPRKVRRVASLISGMPVTRAQAELSNRPELSAEPIAKLLASAVANAANLSDTKVEAMRITTCTVTEGPKMKRFRPVSRGMAHPYMKRMSHINIVLDVPGDRKKEEEKLDAPTKIDPSADHGKDVETEEQSGDTDSAKTKTTRRHGAEHDRRAVQEDRKRTNAPRLGKFFRRKSM